MSNPFREHWSLNPEVDFLNHGSFGATPTCVLEEQRHWRDRLESDPIEFLAPERDLEPKLDNVRAVVARLVGASPENLAWVRNATDGVNAVLGSFQFADQDEILVTDHGYNACINAARHVAQSRGPKKIHVQQARIPFPIRDPGQVIEAIVNALGPRTRLLLVDHVTSPTGLVFPLEEIIQEAHQRGVRVLVDGAHAPGMVPLRLDELNADYYTANHHKWLCGPKASGFLWVRPDLQPEVRPTVISHAANRPRPNRSKFLAEFDWTGTYDPTPLLALPKAIEFLSGLYDRSQESHALSRLMVENRSKTIAARSILLAALGIASPAPESMLGSVATLIVPGWSGQHQRLGDLLRHHHFELPVFPSPLSDDCLLRISMQAYNDLQQIERLADVLRTLSSTSGR